MSIVVKDKFIITPETPDICEYCGKIAELRPYGRNGANICYDCGMKNIETTNRMFSKRIENINTVIIRKGGHNSEGI